MIVKEHGCYYAKVIADSISSYGVRILTYEVKFPRFILAEVNTHCRLSRNSASSRAVPIEKTIEAVVHEPFVPEHVGVNQPGMQAASFMEGSDLAEARRVWLRARDFAVVHARRLADAGVHKQTANRLLEPYAWHVAVLTATEWDNFFALRCPPDHAVRPDFPAQPEFQRLAILMDQARRESTPVKRIGNFEEPRGWHLPYVTEEERRTANSHVLVLASTARCARVSFRPPSGIEPNLEADAKLFRRLYDPGHMSPFQHPALVCRHADEVPEYTGNYRGWAQFRKFVPYEDDVSKRDQTRADAWIRTFMEFAGVQE